MGILKKISWMSLIAVIPIYILSNACGIVSFGMNEDRLQKLHSTYLLNQSLLQWLFWSTVVLFPCMLCSYWLKLELRYTIRGYILAMFLICLVSFFYIDSNIFLPLASIYAFLSKEVYSKKDNSTSVA